MSERHLVLRDGEEIEVFNHASVAQYHYINSVNGYESFEPEVSKGDMGGGPQPEAVTPRVAGVLDSLGVSPEKLGIEVIDPEDPEVDVL